MIESVLVANRGEIARRVFRTCRELGITTVAVYSDADAGAPHVREADAAVRLPGNAPAETYLRGDLIVAAALAAGADAIHPGYGFLSENAGFARSVLDAGMTWIGPAPGAIEAMGSKTRAKRIMADAGVPLLGAVEPGAVTEDLLPLLVKAAAGGGGRGMRIVRELGLLEEELAAAAAEAASAFGDGEVFLEPYVEDGRHIEVQVLADAHGTVWTLGERDCSVQRRHQKVIEETPAPGIGDELRRTLCDAATAAVRAIGYTGAGTVEFMISPDGRPFFLEMNTRLQVEHPVTECVTGLDLVRLQIRVAEGAALPDGPPPPHGHAIEARLYAEDPARGYQPQTGVLHRLALPELPGLRLDSGIADGDTVGVHYDPMLAKVIAWAETRDEAVRLLAHALERARVHGPVTNRELLVRVLRHPDFVSGRLSTAFLDRHLAALTSPAGDTGPVRLAALAAALSDAADRSAFGGWRNVPSQPQSKSYAAVPSGDAFEVRYRLTRSGLDAPDHPGVRLLHAARGQVALEADGVRRSFDVAVYGDRVHVDSALGAFAFTALPRFPEPVAGTEPGSLLAPMPGTVIRIGEFAVGDHVEAGQSLLWLEAMKMEHRITSPVSGTLTALNAEVGLQVDVGAVLAVVKEEARP
ncbi:biotin carboxylase N-terminal domain-containing protein [Streptomyces sp. H10-C2]|uniref:acetyl/propionyl/methylcrotonyl-CoA carboxylase subunit alpha n=1 Tax=unclassified Streptomyces TaxID=2593676 RepID=UPI0024BB94B6|nr:MULTISPECIES: biotin carboxylase N-terminal domain-containing protein [unclassified Streptomyces]MDJ0344298.1 biotin carboxylase N-terminal domain-containing protein [Streptomyces sp. PH10-H1]MDJ0373667.1 biotin carboxylase N-terminal domain-containing protein [Streptomyces sp. H10-C2]